MTIRVPSSIILIEVHVINKHKNHDFMVDFLPVKAILYPCARRNVIHRLHFHPCYYRDQNGHQSGMFHVLCLKISGAK